MPQVKHIILNDSETAAKFSSSHPYYSILNMGDSEIYASENPNIPHTPTAFIPFSREWRRAFLPKRHATPFIFSAAAWFRYAPKRLLCLRLLELF